MNILLKIDYLQLTAKASFSFFKFNPRLKPGAIKISSIQGLQPLIFYLTGHY